MSFALVSVSFAASVAHQRACRGGQVLHVQTLMCVRVGARCSASDAEAITNLRRLADENVQHWEAELMKSSRDRADDRAQEMQAEG